MAKNNEGPISYSKNKKAFHDYIILDTYEAGIVLSGEEVKSIKNSEANLKGAFVDIHNNEAYINEMHISRYSNSSNFAYDPSRKRKIILHRKEIEKIDKALSEKGVTAIPLELYAKKGLIKVSIGLCKGKKLFDKRETLKKRSQELEIKRQFRL